jgi:hypothetical protein
MADTSTTLRLLAAHGDDLLGVLRDQQLHEALVPYCENGPRLLRCSKHDAKGNPCKGKIVWLAISPYEPRVLGSPLGPRSDELLKKDQREYNLPPSSTAPTALFPNWSIGPVDGRDVGEDVDTDLPELERLRWIVGCRRHGCGARYLVTNTQLLALLVSCVAKGSGDLWIPISSEVGPAN